MRPARAFHDLNDVDTLVIKGWSGSHEVRRHADGDRSVAVLAPRRHEEEFWTFGPKRSGELCCFSSLIGSPSLLTDPGEPMMILLPADRIGRIAVRFEG